MLSHKIVGNAMQQVVCQVDAGQTVYGEPGRFLWKTPNVTLETRLTAPTGNQAGTPAAKGGFLQKAVDVGKRVLAGEHVAFQYFTPVGGSGLVTFAGVMPGEVRALELDGTTGWLTERGTFVAAEGGVNFDIALNGLRTGLRSGQGFVLEGRRGGTPPVGNDRSARPRPAATHDRSRRGTKGRPGRDTRRSPVITADTRTRR